VFTIAHHQLLVFVRCLTDPNRKQFIDQSSTHILLPKRRGSSQQFFLFRRFDQFGQISVQPFHLYGFLHARLFLCQRTPHPVLFVGTVSPRRQRALVAPLLPRLPPRLPPLRPLLFLVGRFSFSFTFTDVSDTTHAPVTQRPPYLSPHRLFLVVRDAVQFGGPQRREPLTKNKVQKKKRSTFQCLANCTGNYRQPRGRRKKHCTMNKALHNEQSIAQ
jgi:hypothetical protein